MKDVIISLFGTYEPVSVTNALGEVEYLTGMAGVDWPYVLGALAFIVSVYCVLRIIGGVLSRV